MQSASSFELVQGNRWYIKPLYVSNMVDILSIKGVDEIATAALLAPCALLSPVPHGKSTGTHMGYHEPRESVCLKQS
jgi:hypothetical protein